MPRVSIIALMALLIAGGCKPASAPRGALDDAEILLTTGRAERALDSLLELRIDYTEDGALLYQIACAQYAAAGEMIEPGRADDAERLLVEAHDSFQRVGELAPQSLGQSGAFNGATVLLQLDDVLARTDRYEERVENLRSAIATLTRLVEMDPGHEEGQHNLDSARYRLARLLQNPPGEEEDEDPEDMEDPPGAGSAVDVVSTQIPRATAEVIDGSTIVLHLPDREGVVP